MKIDYRVHGVASGQASIQTEVNGESLGASMPCLEVELTSVDGRSGSTILRIVGSQINEAKEKFKAGSVVTAEFTPKAY